MGSKIKAELRRENLETNGNYGEKWTKPIATSLLEMRLDSSEDVDMFIKDVL